MRRTLKANSHMPYCAHAVPLPFSDSAVSYVKVGVVAGNIRTASPPVKWIGMRLITTFVGLHVVAERSPRAVCGWPMLICACHGLEKSL
jgi:hypothetical protein